MRGTTINVSFKWNLGSRGAHNVRPNGGNFKFHTRNQKSIQRRNEKLKKKFFEFRCTREQEGRRTVIVYYIYFVYYFFDRLTPRVTSQHGLSRRIWDIISGGGSAVTARLLIAFARMVLCGNEEEIASLSFLFASSSPLFMLLFFTIVRLDRNDRNITKNNSKTT